MDEKIMKVHQLKILKVGKYINADYIIQRLGNAFQYIVFWEGQFYQSHVIMNPEKGKKDFTHAQEVEIALLTSNFMQTTVDTLIATKKKFLEDQKKQKKPGKAKK